MTSLTPRSAHAMSTDDLLALIAGRYQAAHRRVLPELIALARKVEHVHHDVPAAPLGLADALEHVALELDMHMQVEEAVVFRAMQQEIGSALVHPIGVMRTEHQDYAAELDRVQELAHDFVPPVAACGSWRRLYQGVAELCAALREQMRLENEVLFPRFEHGPAPRCTSAQA
ncbi:hypothetical protein DK847_19535 [Aestuariivirga litoralis]|uniref:Hemerythrin-like domain-containing protein n=1 Tax=Aestuariivirga litoralis TaxID=2650924 RepID=A0A2W2C4V8_9HYPH|nr:hemerythrin domain-containing protein [Aestuariivirga litoralis]PZF75193.1 hypothetical protein DK847_19535 [Aestuariivirga litoralis]